MKTVSAVTLNGSVSIHRDAIVGKVGEGHFQREGNVLKLTEVTYETFLLYQNDMEDFLPEKESCGEDSHPDVVFGGMPSRTATGRTIIRPNRLDL